jgi:tripartite-type tricarboxylate transporter receptor subunit TctC
VPFPAGGFTDVLARYVANDLSEILKQNVVVKNMPGGTNAVAINHVMSESNDNHTFIFFMEDLLTGTIWEDSTLYQQFLPVTFIGRTPYVIYTGKKDFTIGAFADRVRNGSTMTMGNNGVNSLQYIWADSVTSPLKFTPVPMKGMTQIIQNVLGGHVDLGMGTIPGVASIVGNKQAIPLMVSTERRHPRYPDLPTYIELGFKGPQLISWFSVFARKDTDVVALQKFGDAVRQSVKNNTNIQNSGLEIMNTSTEESARYYQAEIQRFTQLKNKLKKQ